jgi:hypothetical protein
MTTTGLTIDGYRSTKSLGVVVITGVTEVLCYGTAVVMVSA